MFSLFIFYAILFQAASSQIVSIQDDSLWSSQRSCALNCIDGIDGTPSILAEDYLDCVSPIENSCFCRTDLQDKATSVISSCVFNFCQATPDVNTAVSLYTAYCTSNGFTMAAGAAITTATGTPISNAPTVTVTNETLPQR